MEGKKGKKRLPEDVGLSFGGIRLPRLKLLLGPPRLDQGSMVINLFMARKWNTTLYK